METFRIQTTVSKDGNLSIKNLPFRPGEKVEVTVRSGIKNRQALANDLQSLFKEIQALPQAKSITEEEIAAEIAAYRASMST